MAHLVTDQVLIYHQLLEVRSIKFNSMRLLRSPMMNQHQTLADPLDRLCAQLKRVVCRRP